MIETIEWPKNSGRVYTCERSHGDCVRITAKPGERTFVAIAGRSAAIWWLCDRSLKKSKAQKLVDSVLRPETAESFA